MTIRVSTSTLGAGAESDGAVLADALADGVTDGVADGVTDGVGVGVGVVIAELGGALGVGCDDAGTPSFANCLSPRAPALVAASNPRPAPINARPTRTVSTAWARLPRRDPERTANMTTPTITSGIPASIAANHGPTTTPHATT